MKNCEEAGHAMQSGVAMEMNYNPSPTEPKHLRVGVNMALCDSAAIARLLIAKGIITEEELEEALCKELNKEVQRYEARLSERFGKKITLA